MVCQACGNAVAGPGAFCTRCGAQAPVMVPGVPPPPYPPAAYVPVRVPRHLQTLAILWFVYGVYRLATGLFGALFLAGFAPRLGFGPWGVPGEMWGLNRAPFWGALAGVVVVYTGISALLSFLVGYGLTTRRPWARALAIVTAILALIRIPAGTALGIYTLWVLGSTASGMEYEALADRS